MARVVLLAAGLAFVTASFVSVFLLVPRALGPGPGDELVLSENVRWWTNEDGWSEDTRSHVVRVRDVAPGLRVEEDIAGAHSPRGGRFVLPVDASLEVVGEPGVRLAFPPTPLFRDAPHNVYLGVPWASPSLSKIGAIDNFTFTEQLELDGLAVNRYEARHVAQEFVHGGQLWKRATHRVVLVEPLTAIVVDYYEHETLWRKEMPELLPLPFPIEAPQPFERRVKVWESVVTPTDVTHDALMDQAREARRGHFLEIMLWGLPLLIVGEICLGFGLLGHAKKR